MVRARKITDTMAIAAAHSLADYAEKRGIHVNNIVPNMEEASVFPQEAADVAMQAIKDGVARINITWEEAFQKATEMGQKEADTFYNSKQQLVQWQFINISELYRLSELIDGAELYSRIEEKENAEGYIYTVNQKAQNIFFTQAHQLLKLA